MAVSGCCNGSIYAPISCTSAPQEWPTAKRVAQEDILLYAPVEHPRPCLDSSRESSPHGHLMAQRCHFSSSPDWVSRYAEYRKSYPKTYPFGNFIPTSAFPRMGANTCISAPSGYMYPSKGTTQESPSREMCILAHPVHTT